MINEISTEDINPDIANYIRVSFNPAITLRLNNIFEVLVNINAMDQLEVKLLDLIFVGEMDKEQLKDNVTDVIIEYLDEILKGKLITMNITSTPFMYYDIVLNTLYQCLTYNELNTPTVLNIINNDNPNEMKLSMICEQYNDVPWIELMDIFDDVNDLTLINIAEYLENVMKSQELNTLDVSEYEELTNTQMFASITNNQEDEVDPIVYLPMIYTYGEVTDFDVDIMVKELATLMLYAKNLENRFYFIDSMIMEDLLELGLSEEKTNEIINKLKEKITLLVKD